MFSQNVKSFAKINVGLRILNRREDGFHNLETIFYPVKLFDIITIQIENSETGFNSVKLKSNKAFLPLNRDNLCFKAIELFFRTFRIRDCFKINLEIKKNIPVGGGLGGGSSNAASVLKFLIKFTDININQNRKKILELALSLGSDVPFFLTNKPCYAKGRGEEISLLPEFKIDYDILIVNPNLHVSTKWAFEMLELETGYRKDYLLKNVSRFDINDRKIFENDFEEVIFKKYILLKEIKEELYRIGAVFVSMSGSGATLYGLFDKKNQNEIRRARDYYTAKNYFTFISD